MINAKDRLVVKRLEKHRVQFPGRRQVSAKWLFHHHTGTRRATTFTELLDDGLENGGGNRQVEQRMLSGAELFADSLECGGGVVIARNISQEASELVESRRIEFTVPLDALARSGAKLIRRPVRPRHADHWHVQVAALHHCLECRKDFLKRQVAGGAKNHEPI